MEEPARVIDAVLLVRLPRTYRPGISDLALYEATRGVWRLGPRRDGIRYVLAVLEGIVHEVYEVHGWQPAGTAAYETRTFDAVTLRGRWEFIGVRAANDVRQRYVGKSVRDHLPRGAQNPVTYVNVRDGEG